MSYHWNLDFIIIRGKGLFRIQLNIYDGAFFGKQFYFPQKISIINIREGSKFVSEWYYVGVSFDIKNP